MARHSSVLHCTGYTNTGVVCNHPITRGEYCHTHRHQQEPHRGRPKKNPVMGAPEKNHASAQPSLANNSWFLQRSTAMDQDRAFPQTLAPENGAQAVPKIPFQAQGSPAFTQTPSPVNSNFAFAQKPLFTSDSFAIDQKPLPLGDSFAFPQKPLLTSDSFASDHFAFSQKPSFSTAFTSPQKPLPTSDPFAIDQKPFFNNPFVSPQPRAPTNHNNQAFSQTSSILHRESYRPAGNYPVVDPPQPLSPLTFSDTDLGPQGLPDLRLHRRTDHHQQQRFSMSPPSPLRVSLSVESAGGAQQQEQQLKLDNDDDSEEDGELGQCPALVSDSEDEEKEKDEEDEEQEDEGEEEEEEQRDDNNKADDALEILRWIQDELRRSVLPAVMSWGTGERGTRVQARYWKSASEMLKLEKMVMQMKGKREPVE
ncbi:hypothetical protein GTA08_BOTSDO12652 [Botryosphaeria dothidea]|uniref:Uncharacterized protein n=1 Tax=Botryosphaeria dothidea TaxID=55169 RepID=A0A8H4N916_9PEZI|nr:hypothetical protein GTA08_BOTSDO12652 [Botryosphaeria dothidea]